MTTAVGTVNLLDVITADRELPEGFEHLAVRSVRPDLSSSRGYRYPFPGGVAEAAGPFLDHRGSCPAAVGDGICAATTWAGMASGGIPARTLLLVAYRTVDVLGDSETGKLRLRAMFVADLLDGETLLRESGHGAYLYGAYLSGAYLNGAYLYGAYLSGAYLGGAYLSGAYLGGAYLSGAYLSGAYLSGAYLSGAYLNGAYLNGANLNGANLNGANLNGANLNGANLNGANGLTSEQIVSAVTDGYTRLPEGLSPTKEGGQS